jgi:NADH-quinone oxidoreductase subunit N
MIEQSLGIMPIAVLIGVALMMLVADLFGSCSNRMIWCLVACLGSWVASIPQLYSGSTIDGVLFVDAYGLLLNTIILSGTLFSCMFAGKMLKLQNAHESAEVEVLMLLASAGGMVMVMASHLLVLFLGFELLSIAVYALSGIARQEKASSEAALKYFILGAFSSAFLLYGMALVYAVTGSMQFTEIAQNLPSDSLLLLVGIGFLILGFGFKVSLVPFYFWTPDVYQGAPVSVTAYMAVVVKAAAFGALLRLMSFVFGEVSDSWIGILWVMSVVTMTLGNFVALTQKSIKRMLAYSSIAHAGYILMGVLSASHDGTQAVLFYLLAYSLMTIVSFGVVLLATAGSDFQYEKDDIEVLTGLGWSHPFLGLTMTLAMLSLAGMPPLVGFMGKLYLFRSAIGSGFIGLAIIAALNSVVSLYYYLRVIVVMYFNTSKNISWIPRADLPFAPRLAVLLAAILIVYFGLFGSFTLQAISIASHSM